MLTGGAHHQQSESWPRDLGIEILKNRKRIFNIRTAPGSARLGHSKVAARRGTPPLHLDTSLGDAQQLSRLVLGENAGDVVVNHDYLVNLAKPLFGKHADGGR